jgi:hypothetical protein
MTKEHDHNKFVYDGGTNASDKQEAALTDADWNELYDFAQRHSFAIWLEFAKTIAPLAQSAEQDMIDAERFPYQQTFDAIAFATKIEGGGIAISVEKFRKAFGTLAKGASK